jgi:hypothetical protein
MEKNCHNGYKKLIKAIEEVKIMIGKKCPSGKAA